MADRTYNVLFICTGNSARSILAESLMNHHGRGAFQAYSAGSHPTGTVHPFALAQLRLLGFPVDGCRSKGWEEFAGAGAPVMDFVFTVCDKAAGELCPAWPGQPVTAHWGVPDPAAVQGSEKQRQLAFKDATMMLTRRIQLMLSLPLASLDALAIQHEVTRIGKG